MMAMSKGWTMARSAFLKAMVVVTLLWPTIVTLRLLKSYGYAVPKDISTSAFDNDLYMAFQEPYSSYICMPQKVHISQASNVNANVKNNLVAMTVSFTLDHEMCAHVKPTVVYGRGYLPEGEVTAAEKLDFDFASPTTGENYTSDWIYHMELPDLVAGLERYWYRIQIDQDEEAEADLLSSDLLVRSFFLRGMQGRLGQTPDYPFRTPPHLGSPTSLALVGDIGQTDNSTKTMHHIMNAAQARVPHPVSAVLIAGDLSYADGDPHRWERWLDLMEPLLRTTPLQTAAGNHEIECDRISRNIFVPYENYFRNPNRIAPADMLPADDDDSGDERGCTGPSQFMGHYNFGNSFYAFSHGMVQVIVLNSYTDSKIGSVQYNWLEKELQAVDRTITPWLLVMFHCPLHTTFLGHNDELDPAIMLENMEPLFVEHTVNIIVSGHDHAYMRTHAMLGKKLDLSGKGPKYFTLGAGGNRELHARGYVHDTPEVWVAKRDNDAYGYGHFFAANATHAHFTWVHDGTTTEGVQDDVWLINQLTSTSAE